MLAGRRLPTRPLKELTEREVAVSCERAGPERVGQGQRLVEALLEQIGFAEPPELHGPAHAHGAHRGRALYHVREETAGFRRPFREHMRVTETSEHGPGLQAPLHDEDARTLQCRVRLRENC